MQSSLAIHATPGSVEPETSARPMSRLERYVNVGAVIVPFLGFIAALVLLWNRAVSAVDVAILVCGYVASGLGVTVGYHRLLTHRSFATGRWLSYLFAALGSTAVQGPVIDWVADHRKHHTHADAEGDPHSPHVGEGSGLRGLLHAHVGWLFSAQGQAAKRRYAPELLEDRGMRAINRAFPAFVALTLAIPAALGWLLTGRAAGAATALVWGGLVRVFFGHHVTWSINSICHFYGRRRFETDDQSTNVAWLAPASLGEAWHHNHHAFPRSASHGLRWWELDVSGWVIRALERLGLAWNVVRIPPERQRAKLANR
jgi:stearoyl-CoA desaturase (delta-9 desaturase)